MNSVQRAGLLPQVKIGVVAVSRDCFPESLSVGRRKALMEAYTQKYGGEGVYECPVCIVESEIHMVQALEDIRKNGCNALCVYLGNFGPEISETLLAKHFDGRTRGRLLRHAERQLQSKAAQCEGVYSGKSRGHRPGVRGQNP